jgi:hypothetical protein
MGLMAMPYVNVVFGATSLLILSAPKFQMASF